MTYPIIPIGPLGIVALFLLGFAARGILAVLYERNGAAACRRSIAESPWPRIIRDGHVNPKPAGPPPPAPVQVARMPPPRRPPPPPPLCCHCGRADCRGMH